MNQQLVVKKSNQDNEIFKNSTIQHQYSLL